MKRIIAILIILAAAVSHAYCYKINLTYKETHNDRTSLSNYIIESTNGNIILKLKGDSGTAEITSADDYKSYYGAYYLGEPNNPLEIKRTDNTIEIWIKGKLTKKETIKEYPWYANYILLKGFVLSKVKESNHYLIVPENQSIMELKQINEGIEGLELNGKTINAYKVRTTIPDWRSMFWSSYYWYRVKDGILVKTKETRGPPGTPDTIMELVSEEVVNP